MRHKRLQTKLYRWWKETLGRIEMVVSPSSFGGYGGSEGSILDNFDCKVFVLAISVGR